MIDKDNMVTGSFYKINIGNSGAIVGEFTARLISIIGDGCYRKMVFSNGVTLSITAIDSDSDEVGNFGQEN